MIDGDKYKKCGKCQEVKERGEFYNEKTKKDGKARVCKSCCSIRSKIHHKKYYNKSSLRKCRACKVKMDVSQFEGNKKNCQKCGTSKKSQIRIYIKYEVNVFEQECKDCGEIKSSKDFYKSSARKTGLESYCSVCSKLRRRESTRSKRMEKFNRRYIRDRIAEGLKRRKICTLCNKEFLLYGGGGSVTCDNHDEMEERERKLKIGRIHYHKNIEEMHKKDRERYKEARKTQLILTIMKMGINK